MRYVLLIVTLLLPFQAFAAVSFVHYSDLGAAGASAGTWTSPSISATAGDVLWFGCWDQTGSGHNLSSPAWNSISATQVGSEANWGQNTVNSYLYDVVVPSNASATFTVHTSGLTDTVTCSEYEVAGEDTTAIHDGTASSTGSGLQSLSLTQTPTTSGDLMLGYWNNNDGDGSQITVTSGADNIYYGYVNFKAAMTDTASTTLTSGVAQTATLHFTSTSDHLMGMSVLLKAAATPAPSIATIFLSFFGWW